MCIFLEKWKFLWAIFEYGVIAFEPDAMELSLEYIKEQHTWIWELIVKNSLGQYSVWIFSWEICWVFLVSTPGAHALLWNADMNFQNVRIEVSHDVSLECNTDSQTDSNRSKTGVFCRVCGLLLLWWWRIYLATDALLRSGRSCKVPRTLPFHSILF